MKIFSVDAETNGLYGEVWAIGAVVLADGSEFVISFAGQLDPESAVTDDWVRKNVVPVVNLPLYPDRETLLNAFWAFWEEHREGATAVADYGAPVEAGLFRAAVALKPEERTFGGPYPLHELGTAYLVSGYDPAAVNSFEFCDLPGLVPHNPLDDAIAAGLSFQKLFAWPLKALREPRRYAVSTTEEAQSMIDGGRDSWTKEELDARTVSDPKTFPFKDGDVLVLGPGIIAEPDRSLINWEGENYVRQEPARIDSVR